MAGKILMAIVCLAICFLPGGFGARFTASVQSDWYAHVVKPWFMPPGWLFGPVWGLLYTLMGVTLYILWQQRSQGRPAKIALICFLIQLALNAAWTPVFFGLCAPLAAACIIVVLWAMIMATLAVSIPVSKPAAWLLAPYLAWVTFATILNGAIANLNQWWPGG